jgi:site-specific recombinase XerD
MKTTDFSKYLTDFLFKYLPGERGMSKNTVAAYRDTFLLLIKFISEKKKINIRKLEIGDISKEVITEFLDWLRTERNCSNATQNLRLSAIHSFFNFLQYENLSALYECQKIFSIKVKKQEKKMIKYLTVDAIKLLLQQPDRTTSKGRRDLALISLMYDTGARVQEIIDLTADMVRLDQPQTIRVIGKGKKVRIIPLLEKQVKILKNYMEENELTLPQSGVYPLFSNNRKEKLTRAGVSHILQKYVNLARNVDNSLFPEKVGCHSLRHSKAMHLLQAGVNLVYIRDILGHVSVTTTELYARADSKQKREAIEKAYVEVLPKEKAIWERNENLLDWLRNL